MQNPAKMTQACRRVELFSTDAIVALDKLTVHKEYIYREREALQVFH